ncbi:MAG: peptidoglycan DD-metalloendopeptidase family protein [Rhodospirillaceae bacterium]
MTNHARRSAFLPTIVMLILAAVLAGCGGGRSSVGQSGLPATHVVQPGESVYRIAKFYGVSQRDIITLNNLRAPFILQPGQELRLPAGRVHVVRSGDTLSGIGARYGVSTATLATINGIQNPDYIQIGQRVRLAGEPVTTANRGGSRPTAPPPQPRSQTAERPDPVASGPVASEPGTKPGSVLIVGGGEQEQAPPPGSANKPPAQRDQSGSQAPQPAQDRMAQDRMGQGETTQQQTTSSTQSSAPPPPPPAKTPAPPPRTGQFSWPVGGGQVIARFGETGEGRRNDGINIAAGAGDPVYASESGVIAYSSNGIRGFGNLILIQHADDYITAYAHNQDLLVKRGDRVNRGDVIGRVGQTGSVARPQLHFEIRKGGKPQDPMRYLGSGPVVAAR